ncbi:MAG: leucine-rich repeat domain-containing protein [Lachnospiraceae bacterium]|nr:leucine-rich repeat domain-containing protein [Lachnospiraceae bacterium]
MSVIKKKEHLGDRKLTSETVGKDVQIIEDWAYAHCKGLREIYLPKGIKEISSKAFEGCDSLVNVYIYGDNKEEILNDSPHLLAVAIASWPEDTCDMIVNAADSLAFYRRLDERLIKYLAEADEVGFDPFLAGGEEDYEDEENDIDYYIFSKQVNKCVLIYERLLAENAGFFIDEVSKKCYLDYLAKFKLSAAFSALLKDDIFASRYKSLFFSLKLLNDEDVKELLPKAKKDVELESMLINRSLAGDKEGFSNFKI